MSDRLKSRKLWLSFIATAVIGWLHIFMDVDVQVALGIVSPLLSYIGVEGLADMAERIRPYQDLTQPHSGE